MFAVIANVVAFYIGAEILDLTHGSFLGVAVFIAVALAGTLAATLLDVCVPLLLPSLRTRPINMPHRLTPKPIPVSGGQTR